MGQTKKAPVIAVSGLHRGESPQPGGAVIQSIRAHDPEIRFVGISYDIMETGLFSQGSDRADAAYLFPYPMAGAESLLTRIKEVHARENLSLIIPTLDSELENLIALREDLARMGIAVVAPDRGALVARSKPMLEVLGPQAGVATPRTRMAGTAAGLAAEAARIGYPCFVKGALYEAHLVHSEAQLLSAFSGIFSVWGGPVLVQEAIYGEEYDIAAVGDGKGGVVGAVAVRKLLRSRMGKAFAGVVVDDPAINEITKRLFAILKWRGPLEIELVKPQGQPHFLFEINPRFPAWISFAAKIGLNLPAWVAADALGRPVPHLSPGKPGTMFLRHCEDIVADISQIADLSIDRETGDTSIGQDNNRGSVDA
ncbi:MAG: ATP-grasp domain-containing protein [Rhodobacteraceae bacterium]|nr:ATP-grasp domain-containing protein [Paracoccaceae bacterium]